MPEIRKVLNKAESNLVALASIRRDSMIEAADAAFNHAVRPLIEDLGKVSNVRFQAVAGDADGRICMIYVPEEREAVPVQE